MLNSIVIAGRLTSDPELRTTQVGTPVASFSLAVERDYKDAQTGKRPVDFISCVAWRQTGEFVSRYFSKGRMAVVDGRLQTRAWTDKDGNKRKSVEVVADHVYFGDSKRDGDSCNTYQGNAPSGYGTPDGEQFSEMGNDEDSPF